MPAFQLNELYVGTLCLHPWFAYIIAHSLAGCSYSHVEDLWLWLVLWWNLLPATQPFYNIRRGNRHTVKPLNTADLGTGKKAAVFRKRRYWESYNITYKTLIWDLEMGGGIEGDDCMVLYSYFNEIRALIFYAFLVICRKYHYSNYPTIRNAPLITWRDVTCEMSVLLIVFFSCCLNVATGRVGWGNSGLG